MATSRDYYDVLGVSKTSSAAELKSAYRKKALELHPDRNKSPDAETKFKELNEAYQVLSDEQKRKTYDQFGHAAFEQGGMGGAGNPFAGGNPFGGFQYSYTQSGGQGQQGNPFAGFDFGEGGDPFEVFEAFFGGNPFGGRAAKRKQRYSLTVSFREAAKGAEKTVQVDGKQHHIKIPAGSDEGTRIRFTEFDITLEVQPDPVFKRDGYDLFIDRVIPLSSAMLGTEISVPTLDSEVKIKIRPGTQPNTMVRLREHGIQHLHGRGKGDLYIRLIVNVPSKLSRRQRELIEEFERS
ncbi:MAG TPA: DnaJ C-terminal domain-containing protein [Candidatus Saccharimonadia bacterium]|nr:DnaJ C-terminal domain-containing protein [Candidatus Saccharimonadia bacterium]